MSTLHLKNASIDCTVDLLRGARMMQLREGSREVIVPLTGSVLEAWAPDAGVGLMAMIPCVHHTHSSELQWTGTGHPHMSASSTETVFDWGVGWKSEWEMLEQTEDFVLLSLEHRAQKNWPWSFDASQTLHLKGAELSMSLSMTNQSSVSSPGGLGWAFSLPVDEDERWVIKGQQLQWGGQGAAPISMSEGVRERPFTMHELEGGMAWGQWDGIMRLEGASSGAALMLNSNFKTIQVKWRQEAKCLDVKVLDLGMDVLQHTSAPPMLAPGESISVQMSLMLNQVMNNRA